MYTGLGESLPSGPAWSDTNPRTVAANWDAFKNQSMLGAEFDGFQEVVRLGWVPDSPDGYARFMAYFTAAIGQYAASLPEFTGWRFAWIFRRSADAANLVSGTIRSMLSNGNMSVAQADAVTASFNYFFPRYAAAGVQAAPIAPPGEMIRNPVNGVLYPKEQVAYFGPTGAANTGGNPMDQFARPGEIEFRLVNGQTWHMKDPNYVAPPPTPFTPTVTTVPRPAGLVPLPQPPPGSVLNVPPPGSNQEPTIKLPGSDVFVPISSVPSSTFLPTYETSSLPPAVIVTTDREGNQQEIAPESIGMTAGMGNIGMIAVLAAAALLLVPGKRSRTRSRR